MKKEHVEEYLGAIYRLGESAGSTQPLPLSRLQEYLRYSPISIHEMVQKLDKEMLLCYTPYRGVTLTAEGQRMAASLIRRHRIWERFLTDFLQVPSDQSHEIAGELEHAAPEMVTERLALLLGDPQQCPHGNQIPQSRDIIPASRDDISAFRDDFAHATGEPDNRQTPLVSTRLDHWMIGEKGRVSLFFPEIPEVLRQLEDENIQPGSTLELVEQNPVGVVVRVEGELVSLPAGTAETVWIQET
jgi:DtxR family Mn-dependent transcriptional regulator